MFDDHTARISRHRPGVANVCLAAAIAVSATHAFACDPDDEKQKATATFLRHVGDRGHDGALDEHLARLHEQLEELQSELDALRGELAELGGHRGLFFAPRPAGPRGLGAFFAAPRMPKPPKMPKIDWKDVPDVPELRAELEGHMREWQEHTREWQDQVREWQDEQAQEWREQSREWQEDWREHQQELAEQRREQVEEWKEQQKEFASEWRDAAREFRERIRDRARDAGRRARDGVERARERAERRARPERKARGRSKGESRGRSGADGGRVVYGVTGEHVGMLFDLLAPSNVRVIVSHVGDNIAVQGTEDEHGVLTAALQLLNWIDRDRAFEEMRQGETTSRTYDVGEERADRLFEMLAPSEVRVIVSRAGDDAVSVRGTDREHEVLSDFLELLHWRN